MSLCSLGVNSFCGCPCHRAWGSVLQPECTCNCSSRQNYYVHTEIPLTSNSGTVTVTTNYDQLNKKIEYIDKYLEDIEKEGPFLNYDNLRYLISERDLLDARISKIEDRLREIDGWIGKQYCILSRDELTERILKLEKDNNTIFNSQTDIAQSVGTWNVLHTDMYKKIEKLEQHKNYQIDENRKLSRCMEEINEKLASLDTNSNMTSKDARKPYQCPACDGFGFQYIKKMDSATHDKMSCPACDCKGILWG